MYLHLGKNRVVRKADIVAVCDLDNTTGSRITRTILRGRKKRRGRERGGRPAEVLRHTAPKTENDRLPVADLLGRLLRRSGNRFGE